MSYDIFISANSPEDLAARVDALKKEHGLHGRDPVVLVVNDPRIMLCPFEFKAPGWLQWSALREHMLIEAAEILSIQDTGEVSVDFQIFDRVQDRLCGAFLCCPRSVLDRYIGILNKAGLLIKGFTIPSLVNIDRAFAAIKSDARRSAHLNLTPERIDLAIFLGGKCELLRAIPFDNNDEAVGEVIRSLKSVSAKSQNKDCAALYVSGDIEKARCLVNAAAQALGVEVSLVDEGKGANDEEQACYFRLNLARQYIFTRGIRRKIYLVMDSIIILSLIVLLHGVYAGFVRNGRIKEAGKSYDRAQLNEARQLEKELGVKK